MEPLQSLVMQHQCAWCGRTVRVKRETLCLASHMRRNKPIRACVGGGLSIVEHGKHKTSMRGKKKRGRPLGVLNKVKLRYCIPPLSKAEFAVVLAALRKFAEAPVYTEHFDELGHEQRTEATDQNWIDALADRINTKSEEVE